MDQQEKILFKHTLKQFCRDIMEQRIAHTKKAIADAQQSANNEEKSSAGDKYETSRAMGHLEKDMHARQLAAHIKELSGLQLINTDMIYRHAGSGAFVRCTTINLFIAVGLGKQIINGENILFLSPHAPLAKLLMNKINGDDFVFNEVTHRITDIF